MVDDDGALTIPEVREDAGDSHTRKLAPRTGLSRYRLGDTIGRGGMGEIVSAKDDQIGRSVAVKRMRGSGDGDAKARFLREARIQGRLEHPAVVPVHEIATDDAGEPYFVMKQLAGTTLSDVILRLAAGDDDTAKAFPRQRLLRVFSDVCLAVEFAHTRGVIHRDLKPANLMLGDFGEVYILDWGVAHVETDRAEASLGSIDPDDSAPAETQAGAVMGTPGYMSPEQARVDAIDGRTDVYSLGCILFEILALRTLHPRGMAGAAAALEGDGQVPSQRAPDRDIPPELDAICVKATKYDRDDRYVTARALGDTVQAFLDGDRDLALRRQLADAEIGQALDALSRGNDPTTKRAAMRASARALALEPNNHDAAQLVARLMLEPPTEVPDDVYQAIEARELDTLNATRRLIRRSGLSTLAFLPILYWAGARGWPLGITAAAMLVVATSALLLPEDRTVAVGRVALGGWLIIIAVVSWLSSPFPVAAPLVMIIAMATHRAVSHPGLLFASLMLATFVPWMLSPDMVEVTANDVVIHTPMDLNAFGTQVGLTLNAAMTALTGVLVSKALVDERRTAQLRVEYQAWQLRQLVPEVT